MDHQLPTSLLMFIAFRAAEDRIYSAVSAAGASEVTRAQGRLLAGLDPGGTRLVVLAERARITKQTAVSLVDRLEAAGYVERTPDPTDGRARLVKLTEKAERFMPTARAEEARIEAEWTAYLGQRRMRELREALERLRTITDPYLPGQQPTHRRATPRDDREEHEQRQTGG